MLQRRLFIILQQGLLAFAANPEFYNVVLGEYLGLPDKEVASVRAVLARSPIRLQHGYPHKDIDMPVMALVLQAESQNQKYLNDMAYLPLGGIGAGSVYEASFQLLIYSENMDLTLALYEVAKAILIMSHDTLAEQGIMQPSYTGTDIAPDGRYIPENVFLRSLGIRALYQYALPQLLQNTPMGTLLAGLSLPPGTDRYDGDYDSGVTIIAPKP